MQQSQQNKTLAKFGAAWPLFSQTEIGKLWQACNAQLPVCDQFSSEVTGLVKSHPPHDFNLL